MRMAELSRESGVPIATVKYYLREGLLHPGERTSPNQAHYDESHVRRLRLVRALLEVGGLSIASVRETLAAIDSHDRTHDVLGIVQHGLPLNRGSADEGTEQWARRRVEEVAAMRGWRLDLRQAPVEALVGVLCTLRNLGHARLVDALDTYAEAADRIAESDLEFVAGLPTTESIVESAVVGTVLGDAALVALRRIAQANISARRFGDERRG
ncbi:putative transcriptional regulator [Saccharomonospora marina XMU15]|uniref:Putative transcriptional regulator n=1 Tax=Saccharomonospora marina XMU15 TaxID=882083 RepID=H5X8B8_9PSEU|nr:MerR family transcriptional regulator [Saccharomonospora marina]EHR49150.1 putative transcriptional regulator [Saccharomonospora marina XMU15]